MDAALSFQGVGLPALVSLALLVAAYAVSDRAIGAGVKASRWAGPLVVMGLGGLIAGLPLVIMGLAWAISRTQPFKRNAATPTRASEFVRAAIRFVPVVVAAVGVEFGFGLPLMIPAALAFIVGALVLAGWYGRENADAIHYNRAIGSQNQYVEVLRGAIYGLSMWGVLSL